MDEKETIYDIRERLVRIEILLEENSKATILQITALDDKIKVCNHRIDDLESQSTWLWRAVVGGVIAGAIALLFK